MFATIKQHLNATIDPATQERLNQPLSQQAGMEDEHKAFLQTLIQKLKKGEIKTHETSSLFNAAVYSALSESEQERAGITALNLLNIIRQIETLWMVDQEETFQIQNLVETVWQMKAKYEQQHGDVFII